MNIHKHRHAACILAEAVYWCHSHTHKHTNWLSWCRRRNCIWSPWQII